MIRKRDRKIQFFLISYCSSVPYDRNVHYDVHV